MKKKIILVIIGLVVVVVAIIGFKSTLKTSSQDDGDVITIIAATGGATKPYTYVDEDGNLTGQNIELLKAVFDKLPQYQLKFEVTEFTSIFSGLDSNRYQIGVNNFAMNDERKEKYIFTDPIFEYSNVAVFKSDSDIASSISSWSDLSGLSSIGTTGVNTTTAIESYNQANPNNQIDLQYTDEDITAQLQDVANGKYDFTLTDAPMYQYYQKQLNLDLQTADLTGDVGDATMTSPYSYFLVAQGNDQLAQDINQALAEVIADGTSTEINEKYFGVDYTPTN